MDRVAEQRHRPALPYRAGGGALDLEEGHRRRVAVANELQDALVPVSDALKERFEQGITVERFKLLVWPELVGIVGRVPPGVAGRVVEVEAGDVAVAGVFCTDKVVAGIDGWIDPVAGDHQAAAVARANVGIELREKR